jgi:nucleoside-diphosphate-sugar epimerase
MWKTKICYTFFMEKKTILITGGSGYVGAMLASRFASLPSIDKIITIDKEEETDLTKNHPQKNKIHFIQKNLQDESWIKEVEGEKIDVVIHTAWQIRPLYGPLGKKTTWGWNVEGSKNVFSFVLERNIPRLIYFSTVSSYGSFETNEVDHFFTEDEPFRKSDYLYAEEKRVAEEILEEKVKNAKEYTGSVVVLRPAAISGPRGRFARSRFGLQAALSGKLKGNIIYTVIQNSLSFVPATSKWVRQFIHEDDVADIVKLLTERDSLEKKYDVFNICPPGEPVFPEDMANAVRKKILPVWPVLVRIGFAFLWHISMGKVPTARGAWRGYSYPIVVDGSKLTKVYGYSYQFSSKETFTTTEGFYTKDAE